MMASLRATWPESVPAPANRASTHAAATLSGGDVASEVNRLRSAARFHHQERSELNGRARSLAARKHRLDSTLGRLSAIMLGASLAIMVAGIVLHLGSLTQTGMLLTALGTAGTCLWTLNRQNLHAQGSRLAQELHAASRRADNCERLAHALAPRRPVPQPMDDEPTDRDIPLQTRR